MVTPFEFATAARIIFGAGRARELPAVAAGFGQRALVVTGSNVERIEPLLELLRAQKLSLNTFSIPSEPTLDAVIQGADIARSLDCRVVVGIGGGSVIDGAKAIAALATNRSPILKYLEVIGESQPLTEAPLPIIAVPTTAGTGAEVTRNAVLHSPEHEVKISLRSPLMLPRVALVDPELTFDLPPALTASTGMDALTQLIEPFVSKRANPMTDALCREGLLRVARSLRRAFENGRDTDARHDMALGSLFGGLALANAGLGAVHGFAGPIGGMFPAPHGAVCAALLPDVMETNIAVAEKQGAAETVRRYIEVAQMVSGVPQAMAGVEWVCALCRDLRIPRLSKFGFQHTDAARIAQKAAVSSSMKGNPVELSESQLAAILARSL